jgi:RNA polymerase sigma factor (sigma-70 family)
MQAGSEVAGREPRDPDLEFPRLVRAHTDAVWATALRLTGSPADAEDLVQEVFASAWKAMSGWDAERWAALQPRPWLVTICLNTWRNSLRTAARRPRTVALQPEVAAGAGVAGHEDAVVADDRLGALVAALPEAYRAPVVLRHVVGLPYAEVATALDLPVGTVKAQVSRGLALLRKDPQTWT